MFSTKRFGKRFALLARFPIALYLLRFLPLDPPLRSHLLYPAELRVRSVAYRRAQGREAIAAIVPAAVRVPLSASRACGDRT